MSENNSTNIPSSGDLSNLTSVLNQLHTSVTSLASNVENIPKKLAEAQKETTRWEVSLRSALSNIEGARDQFKALVEIQKKFSLSGIAGVKSWEELEAIISTIKSESEDLAKKGFLSGRFKDAATKNVVELSKMLGELEKAKKQAFNYGDLSKFATGFSLVTREINKSIVSFNNLEKSSLQKGFHGLRSLASDLGLYKMRPSKFEKYAAWGAFAQNIREMKTERIANQKRSHDERRTQLYEEHRSKEEGASEEEIRDRVIKDLHGRGKGFKAAIDTKLGKMLWGSRMGGSLRSLGEGSTLRGVGFKALGGIESGLSGMGSLMANPIVAGALVGGGILMSMIDKVQKMNAEIKDSLGTAGIFTGKTGFGAFSNIKRNLTPAGLFEFQGQTYRENLEIAKAMASSGFDLSELNKKGMHPNDSFNLVSNIAYGAAKVAGFNSGAAVEQISRLAIQYQQSLSTTDDFFKRVGNEAKAAGLTTTKYVQIIDDLSNSLGRMNQSFKDVVDTMGLLSHTGLLSAEDLKDYMGVLMNGGQTRDLSTSAFFVQGMFKNKPLMSSWLAAENNRNQAATTEVAKAFKDAGINISAGDISSMSIPKLVALASTSTKSGLVKQTLGSTIQHLIDTRSRTAGVREGQRNPGSFLNMASMNQILGPDLMSSTFEQLFALQYTMGLSGGNMSSLAKNPLGMYNPVWVKAAEALGIDPKSLPKFQYLLANVGSTATDVFKAYGTGGGLSQDEMVKMAGYMKGAPGFNIPKGANNEAIANALKVYAGTAQGRGEIASRLPYNLNSLTSLLGEGKIGEILNKSQTDFDTLAKSQNIAESTRPVAEIFADVFERLFVYLGSILEDILDVFHPFRSVDKDQFNYVTKSLPGFANKLTAYADKHPEASSALSGALLRIQQGTQPGASITEKNSAISAFNQANSIMSDNPGPLSSVDLTKMLAHPTASSLSLGRKDYGWDNLLLESDKTKKALMARQLLIGMDPNYSLTKNGQFLINTGLAPDAEKAMLRNMRAAGDISYTTDKAGSFKDGKLVVTINNYNPKLNQNLIHLPKATQAGEGTPK